MTVCEHTCLCDILCVCACMCACARVCVCMCVYVCVRTCVSQCVCVRVSLSRITYVFDRACLSLSFFPLLHFVSLPPRIYLLFSRLRARTALSVYVSVSHSVFLSITLSLFLSFSHLFSLSICVFRLTYCLFCWRSDSLITNMSVVIIIPSWL